MNEMHRLSSQHNNERIARDCVCCGSTNLYKSPAIMMPFIAYRAFGWNAVEITPEWGLRSVKCGYAYPLCNTVQCAECGLLFLDIRFNNSEMSSLYKNYRTDSYALMRDEFEPGYFEKNKYITHGISYINQIEDFLSPHLKLPVSILDWGGDTGQNAPFQNSHTVLDVYDISTRPVVDGTRQVNQSTLASTKYDLIVCANVLEHIPFPAKVIDEIKKSMHKDSILYIEVPREEIFKDNECSVELYKMKRHWHEHINFFSINSLNKLVSSCGMLLIDMKYLEVADGYHNVYHAVACKLS